MAFLTFNMPGLDIDVPGLAYDVHGLTSEVLGLRPGQTRSNLGSAFIIIIIIIIIINRFIIISRTVSQNVRCTKRSTALFT